MSQFKLSQRSLDRLEGVHPDLVAVVLQAITLTKIDFGVVEGLRTLERQKELVEKKMSQTMNSKHLRQEDGWGHAVDLVPYVGNKPSWNWEHVYEMAYAVQQSVHKIMEAYPSNYPRIRWGGAWTVLNSSKHPISLQRGYVRVCKEAGRTPFLDGPHFEIMNPR